jgi:nitrile hydratase alpha subunit
MTTKSHRVELQRKWNQIVAKAWHDDGLRQRLLTDPASVLAEHGMDLPAGVTAKVHESTPSEYHLVIPLRPAREIADLQASHTADDSYFYTIF